MYDSLQTIHNEVGFTQCHNCYTLHSTLAISFSPVEHDYLPCCWSILSRADRGRWRWAWPHCWWSAAGSSTHWAASGSVRYKSWTRAAPPYPPGESRTALPHLPEGKRPDRFRGNTESFWSISILAQDCSGVANWSKARRWESQTMGAEIMSEAKSLFHGGSQEQVLTPRMYLQVTHKEHSTYNNAGLMIQDCSTPKEMRYH